MSLIESFLILLTVLIHKIIFRAMHWSYESLILYWGLFVIIFFVLNLSIKILIQKKT